MKDIFVTSLKLLCAQTILLGTPSNNQYPKLLEKPIIYILSIKEKYLEKPIVPLSRIATHVTFFGFLIILPLYFFAPFFCCPRHMSRCKCSFEYMSLLDWRIFTPHLISLNNRNSPLSSWVFSMLLSLPQSSFSLPQSSLSPSFFFSSSILSSFSFIFYLSIFESFPSNLFEVFVVLLIMEMERVSEFPHTYMDLFH